jgi:hypothetical protein
MRKLADWTAEKLIFLDESAANERTADRKYGWAPVGSTPHEMRSLQHSERCSILPTYTVNGFMTWDIGHGSYTAALFEEFIENKVLPMCNPFPGPRSVIIMDNAPIHQSKVPSSLVASLTAICCRRVTTSLMDFWKLQLDLWLIKQESISDLVILQCNKITT